MMGFMMLFWLLVLAGIVWAVYRAASRGGRGPAAPRESAEDILRARYARGELDRETYQRMLDDLRREPPVGGR